MEDLIHKGNYVPINRDFLLEGHSILQEVSTVQEKYGKGDTDTFK